VGSLSKPLVPISADFKEQHSHSFLDCKKKLVSFLSVSLFIQRIAHILFLFGLFIFFYTASRVLHFQFSLPIRITNMLPPPNGFKNSFFRLFILSLLNLHLAHLVRSISLLLFHIVHYILGPFLLFCIHYLAGAFISP
jgi:hypothetical protein